MIDVFLVRHGEAAAGWSESTDPGLSTLGQAQAEAVAAALGRHQRRLALRSSPLRRARETAAPLARLLGVEVLIDTCFRELPSTVPLAERAAWLRGIMQSRWSQLDNPLLAWRDQAWAALRALDGDTVVFTHFMIINALVGQASGDERLVVFTPDNGSISHVRLRDEGVEVIARGRSRSTTVL